MQFDSSLGPLGSTPAARAVANAAVACTTVQTTRKSDSAKRRRDSYINAHSNVFGDAPHPEVVAEDVVNDRSASPPINLPSPPPTPT